MNNGTMWGGPDCTAINRRERASYRGGEIPAGNGGEKKPVELNFEDPSSDHSRLLNILRSCNQDYGSPYDGNALKIFIGQAARMAQREERPIARCMEEIFTQALIKANITFTNIKFG